MKTPFILVNFKAYQEAFGEKGLQLAKLHQKIAKETGVNIGIAACAIDLRMLASELEIPVFAQHVDIVNYGAFTGQIGLKALKDLGIDGTILNHAEMKVELEKLEHTVFEAKKINFTTVVCVDNPLGVGTTTLLDPDFIAIEPQELIGSGKSVTDVKPEIIIDALQYIKNSQLLVGGGVHRGEHVRKALQLGAKGILVSSAVVKASDPEKVLRDLVSGIF